MQPVRFFVRNLCCYSVTKKNHCTTMQMAAEGKMTEPIFCHRHFKSKVQHGFRIDLRAKASDGRLP
jgi:hypothetical protein